MTTTIRVSSLSRYHDCPRMSAARTFRQEIEEAGFTLRYVPAGIASVIGTTVAGSAKFMLEEKASIGDLPSRSIVLEETRATFEAALGEIEVVFDGPNGSTPNFKTAIAQTVSMAGMYHGTIAPTVEPVMIEERLEAEVEPGIVLSGQADLVCRTFEGVRDLKTGARAPTSFRPQLGGYSLLARTHGLPIKRAAIDFIARVNPKKPQPLPVTHEAIVEQAETAASNIIRNIASDLDTFRHGDPERRILPGDPWSFAANPSSVLCSPKYCPAFGTEFCHEGRKHHEG